MEPLARRVLSPFVTLRDGEGVTAALMFAYSFLAMTSYNIVKPVTRSAFITGLGADNLPWVQLAAGIIVGFVMQGYSRALVRIPRRWGIPATLAVNAGLLLMFWGALEEGWDTASVGLYVFGLILGLLLISQFWTLANDIYDARHAKRVFGFIGGGASLGGALGAGITAAIVSRVGTVNLLFVAAVVMLACMGLVIVIVRREETAGKTAPALDSEGVGGGEALRLLRESKHLKLIAVIIGCAAIGGAIVEQQLNMAAESRLSVGGTDSLTQFLAQVTVYLSLIGLLIQLGTSRIHAALGIGFALLILPVSLGAMGLVMLFNSGLWAPASARILDTSLRYTVDKTSREILFLPLPSAIKHRAKAFVDVTMDRFSKAIGALLVLVLIKPWGFALTWQELSYASLTLMAIWIVMALRAKREYLVSFRRGLARREVGVGELRTHVDLQTIELLVEELAHPDEKRVLSAIDLLESLDRPALVTPLLLHHPAPAVRGRMLRLLAAAPNRGNLWLGLVEKLVADADSDVRVSAVRAVAAIRGQDSVTLMRGYLTHNDPRLVVTAAVALIEAGGSSDARPAFAALEHLASDQRDLATTGRLEVARAIASSSSTEFSALRLRLLADPSIDVVRAAISGVSRAGADRTLYLPALVSLLRNRRLKDDVRRVLVGYGDAVVEPLGYFLHDHAESVWVRRHIPAVLGHLPSERAVEVLLAALSDADGVIRHQALAALESIHRSHPSIRVRPEAIEGLVTVEVRRFFNALTLHANLASLDDQASDSLLARALREKQTRTCDRAFRLLGLIYPSSDIGAAWAALQGNDHRRRANAIEYLDNVLKGVLRKRVLLMVEDMPASERVERANAHFGTRRRDSEDTLAQLVHDDDPVTAATAIHFVAERGLWRLQEDLAFAQSHQQSLSWYVVEAATWALAGRVSRDARRLRWLDPVPAVELAERLRRITLFDYVSVDELFRFAATARQVRYEPGRTIYRAGSQPESLQFLIEGDVATDDGRRFEAPATLAFEEMLQGTPMGAELRATSPAVMLSLTEDEFLTLLSDNIEVARGLFRMLVDTRVAETARAVVPGRVPEALARRGDGPLQSLERVLVLQEQPLLSRATSAQLLRLASVAREVPLTAGAHVGRDDSVPAMYVLVRGRVRVETPLGRVITAGPGDAVGVFETLTGVPSQSVVTVEEGGEALRLSGRRLFLQLAADLDLLQTLFGGLLRHSPDPLTSPSAPDVAVLGLGATGTPIVHSLGGTS